MKILGTFVCVIVLLFIAGAWYLSKAEVTHIEREIYVKALPDEVTSELEEDDMGLSSPWNKEVPESRIKSVSFKDFGTVYFTDMKIEKDGTGTRVRLIFDAGDEDIWTRASWLVRRGMISRQYETGLSKLKTVVESR